MNNYTFKEISIGMEEHFNRKIDKKDIETFANLTGDFNPLHVDKNFFKEHNFKKPVVHGLLVNSFISTLLGMHLPGKYCLILSIESMMKNPCYEGDILTVRGKVVDKIESLNVIIIKNNIENQDGKLIQSGKAYVKLLK